jgi:hypothetical protein
MGEGGGQAGGNNTQAGSMPSCWRTATWWAGSSPTGARAARSAQAGSTAGTVTVGGGHNTQCFFFCRTIGRVSDPH